MSEPTVLDAATRDSLAVASAIPGVTVMPSASTGMAFTGGDAEIQAGLKKMYADQSNWPSTFPKPYSDEVQAFINQAMAARQK